MTLWLRILWRRVRASGFVVLLRLLGLVLAALLAGAVPTFVDGAMQQVLSRQITSDSNSLNLLLDWSAPDSQDYRPAIQQMDQYLRKQLLPDSGLAQTRLLRLDSTGQRSVQLIGPENVPLPGRKSLRFGVLPNVEDEPGAAPMVLAQGRLPGAGAAEVALLDTALAKNGYAVGDRLRVPLTANAAGKAATVTIVGTVHERANDDWSELQGTLEGTLLTSPQYWGTLGLGVEQVAWAVKLPPVGVTTGNLPDIARELRALPLTATRMLPGTELVLTPITWMDGFLGQVRTTEQLLWVVLLPIYLLVILFGWVTAGMVVRNRVVELAVQRSRGLAPSKIVGAYLCESSLYIAVAAPLALLLVGPAAKLLGLSAGFLKLVSRPLLPVDVTLRTAAFTFGGAVCVELSSLVALLRATRLTVVNLQHETETDLVLHKVLRAVFEIILLTVIAISTQRVLTSPSAPGPLYLALPGLFLVGVALLLWRGLGLLIGLAIRLLDRRMSPSTYLAFSLLRGRSSGYQMVWIMLIVTAGLGIYGASLAKTLDADLVTITQYHLGSDLRIRPFWETEVHTDPSSGQDELTYYEPPYSQFQSLPGAAGTARVQFREGVALYAGSRNLGKVNLEAINPQEFGRVARFVNDLPKAPATFLEAMAHDERAVLLSRDLADRLGIKPGDSLALKDHQGEAEIVVVGIVPAWPGRLPDDGDFLISSLDYLQDNLQLLPYEIWIRLERPEMARAIAAELKERNALIVTIDTLSAEVAAGRRQPLRLGLYGMLTAGFIIALMIMTLSYLLSVGTVLSARTKELGVVRAMGMSERALIRALYAEQLLLLGTSMAAGLGAGGWAASLYVPVLRRQPGENLLPIPAASATEERILLAVGGCIVLGIGMAIGAIWIKRLAIGKALRLGEDG